ncbi:MAG: thiamine phosphate synthase [Acidobacteriota bacterium]|nr:thiamine phosphate synthase [Acidobacteriota bacterium]MDE3043433.1 thiamine phosphate synthase [Acidobacteriota bacterium]MDE3107819.1 thiamine phosphate synthase [Acidobacteriota bacterium]MDE3223746.1 thiamine phosphate synthase [Acidobacteriota bacterium]
MFSLARRHLYLCVGLRDDLATFLPAVLEGGVDVVQLREKQRPRAEQVAPGREMAAICRDFGVPFVMNDDPTLALEVGADGVHVGQDDVSVATCRELLGPEAIIGLSTHADDEFDAALAQAATYLSAGPLEATPTKVGRPGTGLAYVQRCVARSDRPVFVTGGVNATNVASYVEAGLRHFVVVRALTESRDPGRDARELRRALDDALSAVTI